MYLAKLQIYFLWICQKQKSFEWFVDVLREVEDADKRGVIDVHVFVTQFFHKFDLRTTMLVCLCKIMFDEKYIIHNVSVHLREAFPFGERSEHVHGFAGHQSFRSTQSARVPAVLPVETSRGEIQNCIMFDFNLYSFAIISLHFSNVVSVCSAVVHPN